MITAGGFVMITVELGTAGYDLEKYIVVPTTAPNIKGAIQGS
jgi:hypothetical protein